MYLSNSFKANSYSASPKFFTLNLPSKSTFLCFFENLESFSMPGNTSEALHSQETFDRCGINSLEVPSCHALRGSLRFGGS